MHVASSSSRSRKSSGSMGLYPGVNGVVAVASGSVSTSGGGWVVLVLGACCSTMFAANVRVPSTGDVGEG